MQPPALPQCRRLVYDDRVPPTGDYNSLDSSRGYLLYHIHQTPLRSPANATLNSHHPRLKRPAIDTACRHHPATTSREHLRRVANHAEKPQISNETGNQQLSANRNSVGYGSQSIKMPPVSQA